MSLDVTGFITWIRTFLDDVYLTEHQNITGKENTSNKVKSTSGWNSTTTDDHYPSEKLVKDSLDGKANSSHSHSISDVTNLQSSLNGKANSTHSHSISDTTNLQSTLDNKLETSDLLDLIYPIGSIYMEKDTTSHSVCPIQTTLGGTWTRIENRFLYSSENGQGVGTTGGEATHTLTENEMPSHTHTQNAHNHGTGHSTYTDFLATNINVALGQTKRNLPSAGSNYYFAYSTELGNIQEVNGTANATATNQNKGGGQAHNNMPPYIIVNVWERTA